MQNNYIKQFKGVITGNWISQNGNHCLKVQDNFGTELILMSKSIEAFKGAFIENDIELTYSSSGSIFVWDYTIKGTATTDQTPNANDLELIVGKYIHPNRSDFAPSVRLHDTTNMRVYWITQQKLKVFYGTLPKAGTILKLTGLTLTSSGKSIRFAQKIDLVRHNKIKIDFDTTFAQVDEDSTKYIARLRHNGMVVKVRWNIFQQDLGYAYKGIKAKEHWTNMLQELYGKNEHPSFRFQIIGRARYFEIEYNKKTNKYEHVVEIIEGDIEDKGFGRNFVALVPLNFEKRDWKGADFRKPRGRKAIYAALAQKEFNLDIINELAKRFGVTKNIIPQDLELFLNYLKEKYDVKPIVYDHETFLFVIYRGDRLPFVIVQEFKQNAATYLHIKKPEDVLHSLEVEGKENIYYLPDSYGMVRRVPKCNFETQWKPKIAEFFAELNEPNSSTRLREDLWIKMNDNGEVTDTSLLATYWNTSKQIENGDLLRQTIIWLGRNVLDIQLGLKDSQLETRRMAIKVLLAQENTNYELLLNRIEQDKSKNLSEWIYAQIGGDYNKFPIDIKNRLISNDFKNVNVKDKARKQALRQNKFEDREHVSFDTAMQWFDETRLNSKLKQSILYGFPTVTKAGAKKVNKYQKLLPEEILLTKEQIETLFLKAQDWIIHLFDQERTDNHAEKLIIFLTKLLTCAYDQEFIDLIEAERKQKVEEAERKRKFESIRRKIETHIIKKYEAILAKIQAQQQITEDKIKYENYTSQYDVSTNLLVLDESEEEEETHVQHCTGCLKELNGNGKDTEKDSKKKPKKGTVKETCVICQSVYCGSCVLTFGKESPCFGSQYSYFHTITLEGDLIDT